MHKYIALSNTWFYRERKEKVALHDNTITKENLLAFDHF